LPSEPALLLLADWDHDGRVDARPPVDPARAFVIVPPVAAEHAKTFSHPTPVRPMLGGSEKNPVTVSAEGPAARRVLLYVRRSGERVWHFAGPLPAPAAPNQFASLELFNEGGVTAGAPPPELGIAVIPRAGGEPASRGDEFTLTVSSADRSAALRCRIAPALLTSSLDPAEELFIVRSSLSAKVADELARLAPKLDGRPKVRFLTGDPEHPSDIWAQDTMEVARAAYPADQRGGVREVSAPLLGLRAKHDMGLTCGPLDAEVAALWRADPAAVPVQPGEPRGGARWIDWYGNLEVSPPIPGHPFGRVLTGEQKGLRIHPDLLAFLEAQRVQWPPLYVDVSWLTIGHVDEVVNFVPGPKGERGPGFRALLPSPVAARAVLERLAKDGHGKAAVFPGRKKETTVEAMLDGVARSDESRRIEEALTETRARLREGLKVGDEHLIALPSLYAEGLAVLPSAVNCLVVGRDLVIPAPCGPRIDGADPFEAAMDALLKPLGLRTHYLDVFEPYHVRSGEVHCGTNAVRRLPHGGRWWKQITG
jgi:protein-arginine deiminase